MHARRRARQHGGGYTRGMQQDQKREWRMSWIGVESADDDRARARRKAGGGRQDWLLRVRLDGRTVDARLLNLEESEARSYAQRVSPDYTLRPLGRA